jgi:hypothetical protein
LNPQRCKHGYEQGCSHCAGLDVYAPTLYEYRRQKIDEDIEFHGAKYWHHKARYWLRKFIESERECKAMRQVSRTEDDTL